MLWLMLLANEVVDVRAGATAWVAPYNQALDLMDSDPDQALALAQQAVEMAPEHRLEDALEVQAIAAGAAHDPIAEADALDQLMALDAGRWEVFWNGTLDCMSADMDASAYRYAHQALDLHPSPEIAAVAFNLALQFEQWDVAAADLTQMDADPRAEGSLARGLAKAGRCDEALALRPELACE